MGHGRGRLAGRRSPLGEFPKGRNGLRARAVLQLSEQLADRGISVVVVEVVGPQQRVVGAHRDSRVPRGRRRPRRAAGTRPRPVSPRREARPESPGRSRSSATGGAQAVRADRVSVSGMMMHVDHRGVCHEDAQPEDDRRQIGRPFPIRLFVQQLSLGRARCGPTGGPESPPR